jgi:anaerobic magnesium-protoporphyrin IX monomethyl ester cyclase
MKVFLSNVPNFNSSKVTTDWDKGADGNGIFPPIGLMYLTSAILKQGRHEVFLVDCAIGPLTHQEIVDRALAFQPDVVGLSAFTPQSYDLLKLSQMMRVALPEAVLVWGGPHTLWFHEECMEHKEVDYLIRGEAEKSFTAFLDALEDNTGFDGIPGVVWRENGKLIQSGEPDYIEDIDLTPFPAFELLDYKQYYSIVGTGEVVGTICTSRGCPFHCTFCARPYATTYRSRSVENILQEMELYLNKGVREFFFFDDLFNANPERVKRIARGILDKGWKVYWSFRGRIDGIDKEMLELAHRAGCRQIFFGVEASSDEGLKAVKKHITIAKALKVVKMTQAAGIVTSTNWIIGFPHDKTKSDIMRTINTAIKFDSDYAQFNILIALPNTEIFNEGIRLGLFDKNLWKDFARNPVPNFMEPTWEQYFTRKQLSEYLKLAWRKYYFRPKKVFQTALRIRSPREFWLHCKAALGLLGLYGAYNRNKHVEGVESQDQ